MAAFHEHIDQAISNLRYLELTNSAVDNYWDWQITVAFYVAVHLANAHLAASANLHFRTHEEVSDAISPDCRFPTTRLSGDAYASYQALKNLSRRARYLCHEMNPGRNPERGFFTEEKHFAKAITRLDEFMREIGPKYHLDFPVTTIACPALNFAGLQFFKPRTIV